MAAKLSETPGLKYVKRRHLPPLALWRAPPAAIKAGFTLTMFNLSETPPGELPARCQRLWAEAMAFTRDQPPGYDGTIRSLMRLYQGHKESPYRRLKPTTLKPYDFYIPRLIKAYGNRRVANITGLDVMRWHEAWRTGQGGAQRLSAAAMTLSVMKAALAFGQICGFADCKHLREVLSLLRLPLPKPRDQAPTAADVARAMAAAIELGQPSAAFCYALQFETAARQYDIAGQWVPFDDPRISPISRYGRKGIQKWIGPTWADISSDMTLTLTPSKTERTTGHRVHVNLKLSPLVMEAIASIPPARRIGPLVVDSRTSKPFLAVAFQVLWREVCARAGLSKALWNRDLRAGALTEGGMAGASADDRAKLAGHSPKMTKKVYDRDVLVSANRVAEARAKFRKGE